MVVCNVINHLMNHYPQSLFLPLFQNSLRSDRSNSWCLWPLKHLHILINFIVLTIQIHIASHSTNIHFLTLNGVLVVTSKQSPQMNVRDIVLHLGLFRVDRSDLVELLVIWIWYSHMKPRIRDWFQISDLFHRNSRISWSNVQGTLEFTTPVSIFSY